MERRKVLCPQGLGSDRLEDQGATAALRSCLGLRTCLEPGTTAQKDPKSGVYGV